MNPVIAIAASVVGLALVLSRVDFAGARGTQPLEFQRVSLGRTTTVTLDDLYRQHAERQGLDWRILKAIARVESGENPNAVNPTDPSFGIMQILCTDGPGGTCGNALHINGWPPPDREALFEPGRNIHYAAQILRWNVRTYGWPRGLAVYNSWSARHDPERGPFRNQPYVDKVLAEYAGLGGQPGRSPLGR